MANATSGWAGATPPSSTYATGRGPIGGAFQRKVTTFPAIDDARSWLGGCTTVGSATLIATVTVLPVPTDVSPR